MSLVAPFTFTSGPKDAKIAFVGESMGEQDLLVGKPFQGYSGQELSRMLTEAGIVRRECFLTNVFPFQVKDIATLCGKKAEVGEDYDLPHLGKAGQYLLPEHLIHVERLKAELEAVRPNLVVALGATACWALLATNGLASLRGTVAMAHNMPLKVLPTYHPSAVLRNWAWRPIAIADLMKAKREGEFPNISRPQRFILVNPSIDEISQWITKHLPPGSETACDIETKYGMIEMIGFSSDPFNAMVVPFWDKSKGGNYWSSPNIERDARNLVKGILENSSITKIFQNGLYDLQYIFKEGFRPRGCREDTMLLHHSIYPEMQKGLGFLGSVYTYEPAWKMMRGKAITEMKKDD
jgi:uracil-DNA glycosylase